MATISATPPQASHIRDSESRLVDAVRAFWRQFFVAAFNAYRPELHYMRGPGPAWRAKYGDRTQN